MTTRNAQDGENADEEVVATTILRRFIDEGLLVQSLQDELIDGLIDGTLTDSDWKLIAEKSLELEGMS